LGFFDRSGSLLEKWEIATHTENGGAAILPEIAEAVKSCMAQHGTAPQDVMGIGIGVPGPVDADGNVNCCVNLGWGVFNLHQALGALTGASRQSGKRRQRRRAGGNTGRAAVREAAACCW
jgi:glucokinase